MTKLWFIQSCLSNFRNTQIKLKFA